jgi:hypothetical protein
MKNGSMYEVQTNATCANDLLYQFLEESEGGFLIFCNGAAKKNQISFIRILADEESVLHDEA